MMHAGRGEKQGGGGEGGTGAIQCTGKGNRETEGAREGGGGGGLYGEDRHNLKLFGDKSLVDGVIFMEKVQPTAVLVAQEALHS